MKLIIKNTLKTNLTLRKLILTSSITLLVSCILLLIYTLGIKENSQASNKESSIDLKKQLVQLPGHVSKGDGIEDARPLISPDGKTLFFCRRNHPANVGGKADIQDVWKTDIAENGMWSETQNLGKDINDEMPNGICSISPDGNEIYLFNNNNIKRAPLARATYNKGKWTSPSPIAIQDFVNKSDFMDFYFSFEKKVLLMAIENTDGYGDQDICISFPDKSGNFGKPINLGFIINTHTAEFAPYLAADGKSLFFSSYKKGGFGASDIYVSKRLDESWKNWSAPKNLGSDINSENEESYFSITGDMASIYLESHAPESIARTIFKAKLPMDLQIPKTNSVASAK